MNLATFLAAYPNIRLATESDNQKILEFYHESNMDSDHSKIKFKRGENFFAFLNERSSLHYTFLLIDENQKIWGIGVASFRNGYINGQKTTVGYLGDLRVKLNRKLIREWRNMYAEFIKYSPQMPETNYCQHFQTVLIESNLSSKNNLAQTKIPHLHYELLAPYSMINIFGCLRFSFQRQKIEIKRAQIEDLEVIKDLFSKDLARPFAHDWPIEIEHRLKNWSDFNIQNFILIFKDNDLLACTCFWNAKKNKQIYLTQIPTYLKIVHPILSFVPIVKLKPLPKVNQPLEILYLNRFAYKNGLGHHEKKEAVSAVLKFLFNRPENLIAFADFHSESFLKDDGQFLKETLEMGFYTVHYKSDDNSILAPLKYHQDQPAPEFDMSTV